MLNCPSVNRKHKIQRNAVRVIIYKGSLCIFFVSLEIMQPLTGGFNQTQCIMGTIFSSGWISIRWGYQDGGVKTNSMWIHGRERTIGQISDVFLILPGTEKTRQRFSVQVCACNESAKVEIKKLKKKVAEKQIRSNEFCMLMRLRLGARWPCCLEPFYVSSGSFSCLGRVWIDV